MLDLIRSETTGKPGCRLEQVIAELRAAVDRFIPLPARQHRVDLVLLDLSSVGGMSLALFDIIWKATSQHSVPKESVSWVSAYEGLGVNACQPVGQAVAGPAAALLGATSVLSIAGAVWFLTVITVALVLSVAAVPARNSSSPTVHARSTTR
jgi:hypothetical protein